MSEIIVLENFLIETGKNIREIRRRKKHTVHTAAAGIGVQASTISKIETGKYKGLSFEMILRICNFYKVPAKKIIP